MGNTIIASLGSWPQGVCEVCLANTCINSETNYHMRHCRPKYCKDISTSMKMERNTTTCSWEEAVDGDMRIHYAVCMSSIALLVVSMLVGVPANFLILVASFLYRSLRTSIHLPVISLAISGMYSCAVASPILLALVTEQIRQSVHVCRLLGFSTVTLLLVQLLNMLMVGYDRYQAITKPFASIRRQHMMKMGLCLAWLAGVSGGTVVLVVFREDDFFLVYLSQYLRTTNTNPANGFVMELYTMATLYLILGIAIIVLYLRIAWLLTKRARTRSRNRRVAPETRRSTSSEIQASEVDVEIDMPDIVTKPTTVNKLTDLYMAENERIVTRGPNSTPHLGDDDYDPKPGNSASTDKLTTLGRNECILSPALTPVGAVATVLTELNNRTPICDVSDVFPSTEPVQSLEVVEISYKEGRKFRGRVRSIPGQKIVGDICVMSSKKRNNQESKAIRRIVTVTGSVLLCWLLHPILVIVYAVLAPAGRDMYGTASPLYWVTLSVTFVVPAFHAMLYTAGHRHYKRAFHRLLRDLRKKVCHC